MAGFVPDVGGVRDNGAEIRSNIADNPQALLLSDARCAICVIDSRSR